MVHRSWSGINCRHTFTDIITSFSSKTPTSGRWNTSILPPPLPYRGAHHPLWPNAIALPGLLSAWPLICVFRDSDTVWRTTWILHTTNSAASSAARKWWCCGCSAFTRGLSPCGITRRTPFAIITYPGTIPRPRGWQTTSGSHRPIPACGRRVLRERCCGGPGGMEWSPCRLRGQLADFP